jgi:hypothetical protein
VELFLCQVESTKQLQHDTGLRGDDVVEHPRGGLEVRLSIVSLYDRAQDITITPCTEAPERV